MHLLDPGDDPGLTDAARRLLDATGAAGYFGYARRNDLTGERELVCAVRGPAADALLDWLSSEPDPTWKRRLLDSLLLPPE